MSTISQSSVSTAAPDRMEEKRVVITGATSGIGRATALALARRGAQLILVSRNEQAGNAIARRLAASFSIEAEFVRADLSSFAEVRTAASLINKRWNSIDVLVNNAGARFDRYAVTPDGCERTFATNHLGHFLLTNLLLPRLAAAPSAKIITVSSRAAAQAHNDGHWQYDATDFDRRQAYAKSKLANLLFAFELARRLTGTSMQSFAVDPGVAATGFARNNGLISWLKHLAYHIKRRELTSAARGADTLIWLAATSELTSNAAGTYFYERQQIRACEAAYDEKASRDLWEMSAALTKIDATSQLG